jgi:L-ascorbate metabolism protein UlaG (beta-lactamase superfamily)
VKKVYCSLGISAHLEYWGYNGDIITELDWWESAAMNERMTIIAAPARHFSGRGIKRNQTLWSSFIIKTPSHSIYIGGDSGYDTHFKTIGEKYGPFDIALLEAGQYNPMWPLIHMAPEETVQAAVDLKAKVLMPVHWGKFTLAMHPWDEPIQRILAKAEDLNVQVTSPRIGEMVVIGKNYPDSKWWVNNTNKRE